MQRKQWMLMTARKNTGTSHRRKAKANSAAAKAASAPMPSWRRIEALRERRALLAELSDIGQESPELGEDIFFHDDEALRRLYQPAARMRPEEFEIDSDDLDADDVID